MADVKICGITDEAGLDAAVSAGANYVGFVHYPPSPRHLALNAIMSLRRKLPVNVFAVVVLVDPDDALLMALDDIQPRYIQLHGKETPERVRQIREMEECSFSLIKALPVRTGDDIAQAGRYSNCVDMFLFDAKPPQLPGMLPGGNGLSFDWALLAGRGFDRQWMLSGGLTAENVRQAIRQSGAHIVDVSSGVEASPGVKDAALIHAFVKAARAL